MDLIGERKLILIFGGWLNFCVILFKFFDMTKHSLPVFILAWLLAIGLPAVSSGETYPEVLFENSALPHNYSESKVNYTGDSWIKNLKKHLPVSDSIYFTPNNALALNYISAPGGMWEAEILYPDKYYASNNSVLIFKLYIHSNTSAQELPKIQLIQADSAASNDIQIQSFVGTVQENMWLSVEIPLSKIKGLSGNAGISSIKFVQQGEDGKEHQLYVDQIEILPTKTPQNKLTSAAVLHSIVPFEMHNEIYWSLPLTSSIRYIKIYRSEDNKNFEPVAIRPVFAAKYTDLIPEVGKVYYYKVAWVDFQYRESPFSNVKESKTSHFTNQKLLDMVHYANIQYFIDGMEFNSGMQLLRMGGKDAIVSPRTTGVGIMALISGAEQKLITREVLVGRIKKIVDFLEKAESYHGAFPALLDGRTGKGVYSDPGVHVVDLKATSYLMQGLLVANQYLTHDNDVERNIRAKISKLWNAVEWNNFVKPDSHYLFTLWSPERGFDQALPLLGRDALSTYLIALASPLHNIELESYRQALTRSYKVDSAVVQDMEEVAILATDSTGLPVISETKSINEVVKVVDVSRGNQIHYGLPLTISDPEGSITRFLAALLVFDSKDKEDEFVNYYTELQNLILVHYRKSLEEGKVPVSLGADLVVDSKGWINASANIASYPFQPEYAIKSLVSMYRNYGPLLWSEYGFRSVNIEENRVRSDFQGMHHGINAVMIENGKSGLIWKLFSQDQDIAKIVDVLFK